MLVYSVVSCKDVGDACVLPYAFIASQRCSSKREGDPFCTSQICHQLNMLDTVVAKWWQSMCLKSIHCAQSLCKTSAAIKHVNGPL